MYIIYVYFYIHKYVYIHSWSVEQSFGTKPNIRCVDVYINVQLFGWRHTCPVYMTMMTSSNEDIFRVTGPLCGESKGQWRGALMLLLLCVWINGWVINREAGDLRRRRAHYDVIVMVSEWPVQISHKPIAANKLTMAEVFCFRLAMMKHIFVLMFNGNKMVQLHTGTYRENLKTMRYILNALPTGFVWIYNLNLVEYI